MKLLRWYWQQVEEVPWWLWAILSAVFLILAIDATIRAVWG